MSKRRILFVMHMPPPVHGAAVVGAQIRDSRRISDAFECRYLNLSASSSLEEIGRRRFRKLFFVAHLLRQVLRELRGWKPDLVYLTPTSQLPALFKDFAVACLARMYGCKRVLHFHNVGVAARSDRWLDDWVYRRLFDDARVILLSDRLRPDVVKYVPAERISICPNGVAGMAFPAVPDSSAPILLFVSNLSRSKGIYTLLEACRILRGKVVPFRCEIAGGETSDLNAEGLRRLLREYDLEDWVRYHGPVYESEKAALFAQASVFVFPSYNEAQSLVVIEALSARLPVITTPVGALPDLVVEDENGYLVTPGDASALADRIENLLASPERRRKLGESSYARYRELFTLDQFEKKIVSILSDA